MNLGLVIVGIILLILLLRANLAGVIIGFLVGYAAFTYLLEDRQKITI
jgi:hypothetical protein